MGQAPAHDLDPQAQPGGGPAHQPALVGGIAQSSRMRRKPTPSRHRRVGAPADAVALELGSNRNAIYRSLFDADVSCGQVLPLMDISLTPT